MRAVIAVSFERIHRSNLVGMGVIPLCFLPGQSAESLGLTGSERFSIALPPVKEMRPGQEVEVTTDSGKKFAAKLRFDTEVRKGAGGVGGSWEEKRRGRGGVRDSDKLF